MQNGEIYNYVELRARARAASATASRRTSDTEVIAHAYEEWGVGLPRPPQRRLRDRRLGSPDAGAVAGARPLRRPAAVPRRVRRRLLLRLRGQGAAAPSRCARREIDPVGVVDTFTTWSTLPDRSALAGHPRAAARPLPARSARTASQPQTPLVGHRLRAATPAPTERARRRAATTLLVDATRLRLRADVPVATYLSGGLDSSAMAAIAAAQMPTRVAARVRASGSSDEHFDESAAQESIGARARRRPSPHARRARARSPRTLPRVVELAEKPLLRTAPAPLLRLSGAVQDAGLKVVLTGEGADELFAGYDIFREDKRAPLLGARPRVGQAAAAARAARTASSPPTRRAPARSSPASTRRGLLATDDPLYSHRLRFDQHRPLPEPAQPGDRAAPPSGALDPEARLLARLPAEFAGWSPLARAQYLEITTFLEGYLLHAQGDRMLMGHSIEGRFPFLDFRVAEFAARLPDGDAPARPEGEVPAAPRGRAAASRGDLRAPEGPLSRADPRRLLRPGPRPTTSTTCSAAERVLATGLLDPQSAKRVVARFERGGAVGETQEMALVGLIYADAAARAVRRRPGARAARRSDARRRRRQRRGRLARRRGLAGAMTWTPPQRLVHESLLRTAGAAPDKDAIVDDAETLHLRPAARLRAAVRAGASGPRTGARRPRRAARRQLGRIPDRRVRHAARGRHVRARQRADEARQARLRARALRVRVPGQRGSRRRDRERGCGEERASGPSTRRVRTWAAASSTCAARSPRPPPIRSRGLRSRPTSRRSSTRPARPGIRRA